MTRMHGRAISVFLIALFAVAGFMNRERTEGSTDAVSVQSPFTNVARLVSKSVVGVNNYIGGELAAMGSGVVISDKYILTNYHVIEGADRLLIFNAGKEVQATVSAYDREMDAAVLYAKQLDAVSAKIGDSDALKVGEWMICVGNPLSEELRGTVTAGIVSALGREISQNESMIQTDAAINSGNSGGGLFNTSGELIGIPTMKYTGAAVEGIGLAIPINCVKPLIQKAMNGG